MARTKHKIVQKAAIAATAYRAGKHHRKAKNKDLKQAAHQGRSRTRDPRNAPPGSAPVPASVATLPPGLGPPMSSTPESGGRGSNRTPKNAKAEVAHGYTDVYALARKPTSANRNNPPGRVTRFTKRRKKKR